jgi:hypothetical protein
MCEDLKTLVQFGPRSWTLDTYSDTGGCCSLSGTNYRRHETRRRLSCLLRAGQKATVRTAPAPILKRSFKSTCTKPTGHSSRRLRMRLRGFGRGHSASVKPASNRSPRLVWKLYLGRATAATVRRSNGIDSLSEDHRYQLPRNGLLRMYGPPQSSKRKTKNGSWSAPMYSAFGGAVTSGHDGYLPARLRYENTRQALSRFCDRVPILSRSLRDFAFCAHVSILRAAKYRWTNGQPR